MKKRDQERIETFLIEKLHFYFDVKSKNGLTPHFGALHHLETVVKFGFEKFGFEKKNSFFPYFYSTFQLLEKWKIEPRKNHKLNLENFQSIKGIQLTLNQTKNDFK